LPISSTSRRPASAMNQRTSDGSGFGRNTVHTFENRYGMSWYQHFSTLSA
jgi:hypothetical protein